VAIHQEDGCVMNNTEARAAPDTRQSNDSAVLVARLSDEHAADIVEALNDLTPDIAAAVLLGLPSERAVEVLDQPGLNNGPEIVARLPAKWPPVCFQRCPQTGLPICVDNWTNRIAQNFWKDLTPILASRSNVFWPIRQIQRARL
jgi:hypothetical protein